MPEKMTIEEFGAYLNRSAKKVVAEAEACADEVLDLGLKQARVMSSGRFRLAELRKMGHPYAKRHRRGRGGRFQSSRVPYGDPAIINAQSGDFKAAWKVTPARIEMGRVKGALLNDDPKADLLHDPGQGPMIRRPIKARLEANMKKLWEKRLEKRIEEALKP